MTLCKSRSYEHLLMCSTYDIIDSISSISSRGFLGSVVVIIHEVAHRHEIEYEVVITTESLLSP